MFNRLHERLHLLIYLFNGFNFHDLNDHYSDFSHDFSVRHVLKPCEGQVLWKHERYPSCCRVSVLGVGTYFGDGVPLGVVFTFTAGRSELDPLALVPLDGVPPDGAILSAGISDLERQGKEWYRYLLLGIHSPLKSLWEGSL